MAATEIITFDRESPSPDVVDRLAEHILIGGLAVLPTDTVYGLIGDATADIASQAIFKLKNRPAEQALPVFVDRPAS
jgi:L-threonylcarbamoyladenylate synthase